MTSIPGCLCHLLASIAIDVRVGVGARDAQSRYALAWTLLEMHTRLVHTKGAPLLIVGGEEAHKVLRYCEVVAEVEHCNVLAVGGALYQAAVL